MPRIARFRRKKTHTGQKICKGELTKVALGRAEPMGVNSMRDAPLDRLKEPEGFTRWSQMGEFGMDFEEATI
jgi:hypothetical protein